MECAYDKRVRVWDCVCCASVFIVWLFIVSVFVALVCLLCECVSDMPHGTDCPYPIRILAFFEMIRPYHVGIWISGNSRGKHCKACVEQNESFVIDTTTFPPAKFPDKYDRSAFSSVIDWCLEISLPTRARPPSVRDHLQSTEKLW